MAKQQLITTAHSLKDNSLATNRFRRLAQVSMARIRTTNNVYLFF